MPGAPDVIVVGAGPAGENVADYVVRGGLSALLVEAELLGGECSYWACIPSKALLRTTAAAAALRRLPGTTATVDPLAVLARRDAFVSGRDDAGQLTWAEKSGIEVRRGRARLTGVRTISVDGEELTASVAVVLCTGSVPAPPSVPGLEAVRTWGSREATSATGVPPRLGVLGGGVVGCELAQAFARLGSAVTLLHRGARLLPAMEPFAGERVADGLRVDGVDVRLSQGVDRVDAAGAALTLSTAGGRITVDELLLATGRRPNTVGIGLESVGLVPGEPLAVDDSGLVAGVDGGWLYAAGDVTGRAPFTHQGKYAARIAAAAITARAAGTSLHTGRWGEHAATADRAAVPQVVFTDPEVATVGRTEAAARASGMDVLTVDLPIAVAGSSLHADGYQGAARLVVDRQREVPVGATFVGPDVAELLHAATVAVVGEVPLARLWHAVPAFPTISEVWLRLLEAYRARRGAEVSRPSG